MTHSHRNDGDLVVGTEEHDDQHEPALPQPVMANDAVAVEAEVARESVELDQPTSVRKHRGDGDDGGSVSGMSSARALDLDDDESHAVRSGAAGGVPAPRWQYVGDANGWLGAGAVDTVRLPAVTGPSWIRTAS